MSDSIGQGAVTNGERTSFIYFPLKSHSVPAVSDWINKYEFKSTLPANLPVVLTKQELQGLQAPPAVAINAGFGVFEVGLIHLESFVHKKTCTLSQLEGAFDGSNPTLFKNGSLFVVAPGFPRFKVVGGLTGDLSKNKITYPVKAGKLADGKIEIFLADKDKKIVGISWELDVQFAGNLSDHTYFFNVQYPKYVA